MFAKAHSPPDNNASYCAIDLILRATLCTDGSAAFVTNPVHCVHKAKTSENISNPAQRSPTRMRHRPAGATDFQSRIMPPAFLMHSLLIAGVDDSDRPIDHHNDPRAATPMAQKPGFRVHGKVVSLQMFAI